MMKKMSKGMLLYSILFLLSLPISLFAQYSCLPTGARQAGMGRTSVSLTDFWGCQNNQAGMALLKELSVGLHYESRFFLSQLSSKDLGIVWPTRIGVLAATFSHFGYELYNDVKIGIAYARSFGPYFRMGIQLDYLQTTIGGDYGKKGNITFEVGIQSELFPSLTIGTWIFNPIGVRLADYNDERIPVIFRLGLMWKVSENLHITMETEKNSYIPQILFRSGIAYNFHHKYFIRAGFSTSKEMFSLGFGFVLKFLVLDLAATMHESLGFSPQASLRFQFKR
jgi:hypothetical protein